MKNIFNFCNFNISTSDNYDKLRTTRFVVRKRTFQKTIQAFQKTIRTFLKFE